MNVRPLEAICNGIAFHHKVGIDHCRVPYHIERGVARRISRNRRDTLIVLIQEAQRICRLQIQIRHAIHIRTRHHIATRSRAEQQNNFNWYRIWVSHMCKERIVLAAIATEDISTQRVTLRVEQQRIRHMEHIDKANVRQRILRNGKGNHLVLALVRGKVAYQHILTRSKLTGVHEGGSIDSKRRHGFADVNAAIVEPRLQENAFGRESAPYQLEHRLRISRIDLRHGRHVAAQRLIYQQLLQFIFDDSIRICLLDREVSLLRLQIDRGAHLEIRTRCVTLREENQERIFFAFNKTERIQIDSAFHRAVATTDIDHQAVVDEHPHIVIAAELEVLALDVLELGVNFHRETVIVLAALNIPVEFRILNRLRRIEVFKVVNWIEARIHRVVAAVRRFRHIGKPEAFGIELQVDIAASRIRVLASRHRIRRQDFRNKPLVNFATRGTLVPREKRRIHTQRKTKATQRFLHHSKHMTSAGLVLLTTMHHGRVGVTTINAAKINVNRVIIGFASPVENHRRDFHRGANAKPTREHFTELRRTARKRIRIHPHRVIKSHH